MAAYDRLTELLKHYFVYLGYNKEYVDGYFNNETFKELISIRLANANLMIKNKTIRSSHQTHIAITGEAIDFFYPENVFRDMDTKMIDVMLAYVSLANLRNLKNVTPEIENENEFSLEKARVTVGKRTQKQLQLSKRNMENDPGFNELRLGLYENDLLMLLKYRKDNTFLAVGIPKSFYMLYIPDYSEKYETNTYLRMPLEK